MVFFDGANWCVLSGDVFCCTRARVGVKYQPQPRQVMEMIVGGEKCCHHQPESNAPHKCLAFSKYLFLGSGEHTVRHTDNISFRVLPL